MLRSAAALIGQMLCVHWRGYWMKRMDCGDYLVSYWLSGSAKARYLRQIFLSSFLFAFEAEGQSDLAMHSVYRADSPIISHPPTPTLSPPPPLHSLSIPFILSWCCPYALTAFRKCETSRTVTTQTCTQPLSTSQGLLSVTEGLVYLSSERE